MTVTPVADPCVGNLATPVNSSYFSRAFLGALPAYRPALSPNRRGLEVGMAHGFFLYGPFTTAAPCAPPSTPAPLVCSLPWVWFRS